MVDAIARPAGRARSRPGWTAGWQALLVFVLAALLYTALDSELPIDDAVRFTPHVAAGVFEWDAAHLLMQPAAVLWHRHLSFGGAAMASQKRFNAFCAALSLGIFYLLLARLGAGPLGRVVLTAVAACSFDFLQLAASGHIKPAVLPFLTLALAHATLWEREALAGGPARAGWLAAAAVELGAAAGFLVNSLLAAPFVALAVLGVSLRSGPPEGRWRAALGRATAFAALCGGTALAILGTGYALVARAPHGVRGFLGFLLAKSAGRNPSAGIAESLARGVFGVVQSFVYVGDFGAMLRSWLGGDASFLAAHRRAFLAGGALFLAALALVAWIFFEAARRLISERRGRRWGGVAAVPLAFVLGAVAFAVVWNLNEADFYFQITLPTLALLAAAPPAAWRMALQALLLVLVASTVLLGWALPRKRYPLHRYEAELRAWLTPRDLAVHWFDYSGGPTLIFMDLPGIARLHPDRIYERDPSRAASFRGWPAPSTAASARGGACTCSTSWTAAPGTRHGRSCAGRGSPRPA